MNYVLKIGQTFYARIVVPLDLQPYFRQKEFKKSLRTKSRKEAKILLPKTLHEWQQQFFHLRYIMDQRPPSQEAIDILAREYPDIDPTPRIFDDILGLPKRVWPVELMHIQDILDLANPPKSATTIINNYRTINVPANNPMEPVNHRKNPLTVKEAVAAWLESDEVKALDNKPRGTQATYIVRMKKFTDHCGDMLLEEVNDYKFLSNYINVVIEKHAKSYREALLTVITQMITYHHQLTRNDRSGCSIVAPPTIKVLEKVEAKFERTHKKANAPYTSEALQALFDSFATKPAKRTSSTKDKLIHLTTVYATLLALYTGHRISDLKYLRAKDFDFEGGIPRLIQKDRLIMITKDDGSKIAIGTTNKTSSDLTLPLHKHLLELNLAGFINIFGADKQPFEQASTVNQRLSAQLKKAGIKQDRQLMHALRATISNKYETVDAPDNMKELLLNHSIAGTRKFYDSHEFLTLTELPTINNYVQRLNYNIDFTKLKAHLEELLKFFI